MNIIKKIKRFLLRRLSNDELMIMNKSIFDELIPKWEVKQIHVGKVHYDENNNATEELIIQITRSDGSEIKLHADGRITGLLFDNRWK